MNSKLVLFLGGVLSLLGCLHPHSLVAAESQHLPQPTTIAQLGAKEVISSEQCSINVLAENTTTNHPIVKNWRQHLPVSLQNRTTLHKLNIDGCTVYLLGTSHVSKSSCNDVQELIAHLQPQGLFLELCSQRLAILNPPPTLPPPEPTDDEHEKRSFFGIKRKNKIKKPKLSDLIQNVKEQHPEMSQASATSSALLTKIQSDYAGKLNITIGAEFREAYEAARQMNRENQPPLEWPYRPQQYNPYCRVVLGDRPVRLTLVRCWESLRSWGRIKLVLGLMWSSLFQPSEKEITEWMDSILNGGDDVLSKSIDELRDSFPSVARVIIEERDTYMFCKMVQMVDIFRAHVNNDGSGDGGIGSMVAVVGAGHCPGICRWVELYNNRTLDPSHDTFYKLQNQTVEELLKNIIETKNNRHDSDDEMKQLLTEVVELHSA
jgi:pheromone shutdown protein TraB